jgi:exodeoxyribonuclease VII large subunit
VLSQRIYSVGELTRYMRKMIEGDPALSCLWVRGEVSDCKLHSSGHMYFSLKDDAARLKGVMFRSQTMNLRFKPEAGMEVLVLGYIGIYEKGGEYQIYAQDILPAGKGELYLAFNELKARLEAEGFFDAAKKRPLPLYPRKIAVVTSPTGAAVRDIITVSRRRYPNIEILIVPCLVQGERAPESIVKALALADDSGAQVIILARGGGSAEELWSFNDEGVARAIRACNIPVVSAVGHETDFTIADFVADLRAPTPSAGAEMVVPDMGDALVSLEHYERRMAHLIHRRLEVWRERLGGMEKRASLTRPERRIRDLLLELDRAQERMDKALNLKIRLEAERIAALSERLSLLDPLSTLARGYSLTIHYPGGVRVKGVHQVEPGDMVEVLLADGRLLCQVKEKGARRGDGDDL